MEKSSLLDSVWMITLGSEEGGRGEGGREGGERGGGGGEVGREGGREGDNEEKDTNTLYRIDFKDRRQKQMEQKKQRLNN